MTQTFQQWWASGNSEKIYGIHRKDEIAETAWNAAIASQSANCEPKHEMCFETFEEYWETIPDHVRQAHIGEKTQAQTIWGAARAETGAVITTDDEPAVYGQMYVIKQVNKNQWLERYQNFNGYFVGYEHLAKRYTYKEADDIISNWPSSIDVIMVPAKKKSINLEDTIKLSAEEIVNLANEGNRIGAILEDVAEKVQGITGTNVDFNATEPTMQLRWRMGVNFGMCLQQFHRYLHKEGGEWRDVPTV